MAHHFPSTNVRSQFAVHEAGDFGELLYQQLRNAPWVGLSLAAHGLVFVVFLIWPWDTTSARETAQIRMGPSEELLDTLDEDPPPEVDETEYHEEVDRVTEDPVLDDAKLSDHTETDNDQPTEEALGDPRFESNAPYEGAGTNATIGIGGNAGGAFGGRLGGHRNLTARGGARQTENAVDLALEWLKNHQSPGGQWDCEEFSHQCKLNKCPDPGEAAYTPGVSGLALLCFLGRGETHKNGSYKETVRNGLKYLKSIQDSEGCFGPRTSQHYQYNHACAALAMTEAYGMTKSRLFRDAAQRGVQWVINSQNPYLAWRYGVKDGDNDTSVTGWMAMVIKSAAIADIDVDTRSLEHAITWVDRMTEPEFGRVGYQQRGGQPARHTDQAEDFPRDRSESMTAVGVLTRIFAGQDPDRNEMIRKGADLMAKKPPVWDLETGDIDMYYWYYGTLAMFQVGGERWKGWNRHMKTAIVDSQRTKVGEDERGSWDAVGPWGPDGGRVYSTALMCLCLEVYYRYGRGIGVRISGK